MLDRLPPNCSSQAFAKPGSLGPRSLFVKAVTVDIGRPHTDPDCVALRPGRRRQTVCGPCMSLESWSMKSAYFSRIMYNAKTGDYICWWPYNSYHRMMTREKPSNHAAHDPETPAMLYPRGGIREDPEPPDGFPYMPDLLPRLVRISIPSIHRPDRKLKPTMTSPRRVSRQCQHLCTIGGHRRPTAPIKRLGTTYLSRIRSLHVDLPAYQKAGLSDPHSRIRYHPRQSHGTP